MDSQHTLAAPAAMDGQSTQLAAPTTAANYRLQHITALAPGHRHMARTLAHNSTGTRAQAHGRYLGNADGLDSLSFLTSGAPSRPVPGHTHPLSASPSTPPHTQISPPPPRFVCLSRMRACVCGGGGRGCGGREEQRLKENGKGQPTAPPLLWGTLHLGCPPSRHTSAGWRHELTRRRLHRHRQ